MAFRGNRQLVVFVLGVVCLLVVSTQGLTQSSNAVQTVPDEKNQTVNTNGTAQTGNTTGTVPNGQTNGTNQNTQTNGTSQNTMTNGTSTIHSNQTNGTSQNGKQTVTSLLSSLSPGLVRILQQVGSTIPGFQDVMDAGIGLDQSQIAMVKDFVDNIMSIARNTNLRSFSGVVTILESFGLSDSFTHEPIPKDTGALCTMIIQSTENGNTTLAKLLRLKDPLDAKIAWMGFTTIDDSSYWCHNNFTNVTFEMDYPVSIAKSYSAYEWKKCQSDINLMFGGLGKRENWALQMLDASAKPGSSILRGGFKFMGNYKECQDVSHLDPTSLSRVDGKICRAHILSPLKLPPSPLTPGGVRILWDVCMPKSCRDSDMNLALFQNNFMPQVYMECTKDLDMSDDSAAIVAVAVLTLFGLLLVAGTIMEFCVGRTPPSPRRETNGRGINGHAHINQGFDQIEGKLNVTSFTETNGKQTITVQANVPNGGNMHPDTEHRNGVNEKGHNEINEVKDEAKKPTTANLHRWERALLAFSIPRNTEKILSVKSAAGTIGCLHGIRVLSMAWVILGHTLIQMGIYENPAAILERINKLDFQLIMNAPLSVDTFFVMSGLLTCYLFMKTLGKKGKVAPKDLALYYIHRYWRLTPSLIIWIMIVACLLQYVGEGRPAWSDYVAAKMCRDNWWTNILYINNVYKQEEACVGVTWFLAHDMQFYVVAPIALVPWVYGKKILGFFMAFVYIAIHVSSTIWLEIKYNADLLRNQADYSPEIYFKPYTRCAPFAIGMMLGWVLWKTKCKVRMNKCVAFMGWIVCIGLVLTLTLVTYDENKDIPASDWSKTGRVVFETFYRPVWAMAISWLIFACATGYGGYINSVLSWGGWLPLSRLTYSAYLVHLTILGYETYYSEYTMLFTLTSLSYYFLGTFVLAYAVGYILTITVESPMLALEKVVLG